MRRLDYTKRCLYSACAALATFSLTNVTEANPLGAATYGVSVSAYAWGNPTIATYTATDPGPGLFETAIFQSHAGSWSTECGTPKDTYYIPIATGATAYASLPSGKLGGYSTGLQVARFECVPGIAYSANSDSWYKDLIFLSRPHSSAPFDLTLTFTFDGSVSDDGPLGAARVSATFSMVFLPSSNFSLPGNVAGLKFEDSTDDGRSATSLIPRAPFYGVPQPFYGDTFTVPLSLSPVPTSYISDVDIVVFSLQGHLQTSVTGGTASYLHTAGIDIGFGDDVTMTSASGLFLTGEVPEPPPWATMLAGLAMLGGIAGWHRRIATLY